MEANSAFGTKGSVMKQYLCRLVTSICLVTCGSAGLACNVDGYEPEDVKAADVVVVGRLSNYQLIPILGFAEKIRPKVEDGTASTWERQEYGEIVQGAVPGGFYGKFDIEVEEVLKGKISKHFSATLHAYTPCCYGPDTKEVLPRHVESQRYVIAFQQPRSNAYLGSSADSDLPTVHIDGCIGPFLMRGPDEWAKHIKEYLAWAKAREGQPTAR